MSAIGQRNLFASNLAAFVTERLERLLFQTRPAEPELAGRE